MFEDTSSELKTQQERLGLEYVSNDTPSMLSVVSYFQVLQYMTKNIS